MKDIIAMAGEVGIKFDGWGLCHTGNVQLQRFADLVRVDQRDCRTCKSFVGDNCISCVQCVGADQFTAAAPVRLWSAKP